MRKLIKHRRHLNKNKYKCENREEFNFMTKVIRLELKEIKNKNWSNFANNINNNPLASKKCWKRINDIKNHGLKKKMKIIQKCILITKNFKQIKKKQTYLVL